MTTSMTSAQFAWKQFSATHIQRESGADEHLEYLDEYPAEKIDFDMPVPVTSTPSTKSKKRVQWSPTKYALTAETAATTATTDTISPVAAHAAGFEQVKKAKTRSERRAEEPEIVEQVQEPVTRKERRTEYWVHRDDLRRNNARTMKNRFQEFEE